MSNPSLDPVDETSARSPVTDDAVPRRAGDDRRVSSVGRFARRRCHSQRHPRRGRRAGRLRRGRHLRVGPVEPAGWRHWLWRGEAGPARGRRDPVDEGGLVAQAMERSEPVLTSCAAEEGTASAAPFESCLVVPIVGLHTAVMGALELRATAAPGLRCARRRDCAAVRLRGGRRHRARPAQGRGAGTSTGLTASSWWRGR